MQIYTWYNLVWVLSAIGVLSYLIATLKHMPSRTYVNSRSISLRESVGIMALIVFLILCPIINTFALFYAVFIFRLKT